VRLCRLLRAPGAPEPLLDPGPRQFRRVRERVSPQHPLGPRAAGHVPYTPSVNVLRNVDVAAVQLADPGVSADAAESSFHEGEDTGYRRCLQMSVDRAPSRAGPRPAVRFPASRP
jgi:hypothetical protein